jgi:CHRD domain
MSVKENQPAIGRLVKVMGRLLVPLFILVMAQAFWVGVTPAAASGLASSDDGGRRLTATLTGAAEVPGPGDPNASGTATITLNPGQEEVCWEITVSGITLPAIAAHIHFAPVGVAGPIVVSLTPPDASGFSSGCTSVNRDLVKAILKNPSAYYVNVHTTDFQAGAARGQLTK